MADYELEPCDWCKSKPVFKTPTRIECDNPNCPTMPFAEGATSEEAADKWNGGDGELRRIRSQGAG